MLFRVRHEQLINLPRDCHAGKPSMARLKISKCFGVTVCQSASAVRLRSSSPSARYRCVSPAIIVLRRLCPICAVCSCVHLSSQQTTERDIVKDIVRLLRMSVVLADMARLIDTSGSPCSGRRRQGLRLHMARATLCISAIQEIPVVASPQTLTRVTRAAQEAPNYNACLN